MWRQLCQSRCLNHPSLGYLSSLGDLLLALQLLKLTGALERCHISHDTTCRSDVQQVTFSHKTTCGAQVTYPPQQWQHKNDASGRLLSSRSGLRMIPKVSSSQHTNGSTTIYEPQLQAWVIRPVTRSTGLWMQNLSSCSCQSGPAIIHLGWKPWTTARTTLKCLGLIKWLKSLATACNFVY